MELRPPCFVPCITGTLFERNLQYLTWQLASLYKTRKAGNVEPFIQSVKQPIVPHVVKGSIEFLCSQMKTCYNQIVSGTRLAVCLWSLELCVDIYLTTPFHTA